MKQSKRVNLSCITCIALVGGMIGLFGNVTHSYAAFSGQVANTSGTTNAVTVDDAGNITITPTQLSNGSYTATLNPSSMASFMQSNGRALTCYTSSSSDGGGGGSSYGGGGGSDSQSQGRGYVDTDGDGRGDTSVEDHVRATGQNYNGPTSSNTGGRMDGTSQGTIQRAMNGGTVISSTGNHNGNSDGRIGIAPGGSSSSGSSSSSSSSSGGGGGKSVICTHFYRRKRLPGDLWRADLEFTNSQLSATAVRGYHTWGIRSVELMRKHPWTESFFWFLAKNRAEEIGYQLGLRTRPNYKGKMIRLVMEPLCFLIGIFMPQQNWQKVHADMETQTV